MHASTALLGERLVIETCPDLFGRARARTRPDAPVTVLAIGNVDHDRTARDSAATVLVSLDPRDTRPRAPASALRGGPWESGFTPLPATEAEVGAIAAIFASKFGDASRALVLQRENATREKLIEVAPVARFVHVAAHGWFAPESVHSNVDREPPNEASGLRSRLGLEERVSGMSPMLLCGLALAGANLPSNELGRVPGLVTAQDIAALDLSNCELAVLSACDTNVGVQHAGQGVASLQKALHMAGARTVITSLWKVPDEATKELMVEFYRRIWVEREPKARALWGAKTKLRAAKDERGAPKYTTRDWGAWVLTGAPD
jgi:CHAT domain-containing protein